MAEEDKVCHAGMEVVAPETLPKEITAAEAEVPFTNVIKYRMMCERTAGHEGDHVGIYRGKETAFPNR